MSCNLCQKSALCTLMWLVALGMGVGVSAAQADDDFANRIQPILVENCYGCHAQGQAEGKLSFDTVEANELLNNQQLWWNVLKNVRAGLMPPASESRLREEDRELLLTWIKTNIFKSDIHNPDPGRVTVRRLNRKEYRNTIRDLMGIDYNADVVFPPDDTGFGFDNNGDVLSLSPIMLEKYLASARAIVQEAVPVVSKITPIYEIHGGEFRNENGEVTGESLDAKQANIIRAKLKVENDGEYRVKVQVRLDGSFFHNPARCTVKFFSGDQQLYQDEYGWDENKKLTYEFVQNYDVGEHEFRFEVTPVAGKDSEQSEGEDPEDDTFVNWSVDAVSIEGPLNENQWVHPKGYERFFHLDEPPEDVEQRQQYTREVLERFANQAFRRPADSSVVDRLVAIAQTAQQLPKATYESGVAQAMIAVLASPRFLFRLEQTESNASEEFLWIDEYSLASRLSYFLWSTMPDAELMDLASKNQLRANLPAQIERMMKDKRSDDFVHNFVGQWLRSRDIEHVSIDPISVMGVKKEYDELLEKFRRRFSRDPNVTPLSEEESKAVRKRFRELRSLGDKFDSETRQAMQEETQMLFEHIVRNDLSVLDLIDCDYTFVNEKLAEIYGIEGVEGEEMRRIQLPPDSPRGGVLTQGTMLVVTSNPTRTSPVKRGLFILENILALPAPPAPANVPELEASAEKFAGREPPLRELLAAHRESALCASCHSRMDPLGLALENFNAIGMWRDTEQGLPVDASGTLATGESFTNIRELKKILRNEHRQDFYRCLTQKMLIYALGRGLDFSDEVIVDGIVAKLDANEGRFSTLLSEVVQSAAFQKQRRSEAIESVASAH